MDDKHRSSDWMDSGSVSTTVRAALVVTLLSCLSLVAGLVLAATASTDATVGTGSAKQSALRQEQAQKVEVEYRGSATQAAGSLLNAITRLASSPEGVSEAVTHRITELSGALNDITGSLRDVTGSVVDIASLFKKGGASGTDSSPSNVKVSVENNVPPAKVTVVPEKKRTKCHSRKHWHR